MCTVSRKEEDVELEEWKGKRSEYGNGNSSTSDVKFRQFNFLFLLLSFTPHNRKHTITSPASAQTEQVQSVQ